MKFFFYDPSDSQWIQISQKSYAWAQRDSDAKPSDYNGYKIAKTNAKKVERKEPQRKKKALTQWRLSLYWQLPQGVEHKAVRILNDAVRR